MAEIPIEIIITAQNTASQQLKDVQQQAEATRAALVSMHGPEVRVSAENIMQLVKQDAALLREQAAAADTAERSLGTTRQTAVQFATTLASQVNPTLGQVTSQVAALSAGALTMTSVLSGVGVVAAEVAAALVGKLVDAWQKSRLEMEQFQRAAGSFDLKVIDQELDRIEARLQRASDSFAAARGGGVGSVTGGLGLGGLFSSILNPRYIFEPEAYVRESAREDFQRDEALRQQRQLAAMADQEGKDIERMGELARRREMERLRVIQQHELAARGLYDWKMDPLEAAYAQSARQADDFERGIGTGVPDRAGARAIRSAAEARRTAGYQQRSNADWVKVADATFAETEAAQRAEVALTDAARKAEEALQQQNARGWVAMAEQRFAETEAEQRAELAIQEEARRRRNERLQAQAGGVRGDLARLELLGRMPGLSRYEQESLSLTLSAERERLRMSELDLRAREEIADPDKAAAHAARIRAERGNVELEEGMRRYGLARSQQERLDPVAGFQASLRQLEESHQEWGAAMQRVTADVAQGMYASMSDGFFSLVTGNFAALPTVARQFGAAMVRAFTDELARMAVGGFAGQLRAMLFGGPAGGLAGFSGAPVAGLAAGAEGMALPGALLGEGYGVVGVPGGVSAVGGGGGMLAGVPGSIRGYLSTPVGAFLPEFWSSGGALSGQEASLAAAAEYGDLGGVDASRFAGTSLGQMASYAGAGLAIAGLAYQTYGGLTDPYQKPTTESVVGGTMSAAMSGLAAGAMVGSIVPGIGTAIGGAAGLVVGAVAGFASSSKTGTKVRAIDRRQKKHEAARSVYDQLAAAIDGGFDHDDAASRPLGNATVGGVLMRIAQFNAFGYDGNARWQAEWASWPPGDPDAKKTLAILQTLGYQPVENYGGESGTAETLTYFSIEGKDKRANRAESARMAQGLLRGFLQKSSRALIQFTEDVDEQFRGLRGSARNVSQTTVLNVGRLNEARGQDLSLIRESFGGNDEQMVRLLQRLAKVDRDYDVGILRTEQTFGAQVTIGHGTL